MLSRLEENALIRTITGLILGTVIIGILFISHELFSLTVLAIALYGLREYFKVTGISVSLKVIGFLVMTAMSAVTYILQDSIKLLSYIVPLLLISFIIAVILKLIEVEYLKVRDHITSFSELSLFTFALLYIVLPFSLAIALGRRPTLFMFLILSVFTTDIFAYFIGTRWGRKVFKTGFFNSISPNKTWEGAICGYLSSVLITSLYVSMYHDSVPEFSRPYLIIPLIVLIPIVSMFSDLVESLFKRAFKVKDTDSIIFGHGGVLDRFDSLMLPILIFFLSLSFFR